MTPFDVCGPLPTGTTLLEASAGTGKTFTIAALTARYVAEGVAELSQLMLVTFGNAASRELRDRVRERLVSAERGLRDAAAARASEDDVLRLLAAVPDGEVEQRRQRLARALAGFDDATIATTHSFCSQMLTGLGTAADTDPAATFRDDLDDLVREVVDDLYLRAYARAGADEPRMSHPQMLQLGRSAVSDRSAELVPAGASGLPGQRRAAVQAVRDEVERRKRRLGLVDYDDWLALLRDALTDPVTGPVACARVRERYRVVLVDEFQDTDPVQWDVLRHAFDGSTTLVLIGDPKQAIYAFRGGDVTTYLAASAVATTRATLVRNWRSDAPLLDALQHLLGGAALGDPRIVVHPVEAACAGTRLTGAGASLRVRQVARTGHGPLSRGLPKVDPVRAAVAQDVAADLVGLLTGPARLPAARWRRATSRCWCAPTGRARWSARRSPGRACRRCWPAAGSVFATPSARSWLVLLEALEQPHRRRPGALGRAVGVPRRHPGDARRGRRRGDRPARSAAARLGRPARRARGGGVPRGAQRGGAAAGAGARPARRRAAAHRPAPRRPVAARRRARRSSSG